MFPKIPEGGIPDSRAPGEPWHIGLMVTQERAIATATALFPDEVADGSDCFDEKGRPCRCCAARNEAWAARVAQVRAAMLLAFR